ncbi:MAG: ABC transporter ATP-binding protein [Chloroflexi bacterium]|nr:ABC transporter ATP-binding protein [Chloroflexota bacterium]
MSTLKVDGVSKNFGGLMAVHKVSFTVPEGKIVGLIGPNGAGKTTLFNLITGFITPAEGKIQYNGHDLTRMAPYQITKIGIGRTFQNIRLFPRMSVLDNVLVAQDIHAGASVDTLIGFLGKKERKLRHEAEDILGFFGLWERRFEKAGALPYGDQHRLEIARALATRAKFILLDEPAAGMNQTESEHLVQQILEINRMGKTLLVIEHDMNVIMGVCDTIVVLNFGEKIAEDAPEEIQTNSLVLEAYLGRESEGVRRK